MAESPAAPRPHTAPDIVRYRPEDRGAVDALFRRVHEGAENFAERWASFHERWDWQYAENPQLPDGAPVIWLIHDGATVAGQFATIPVRLVVNGTEFDAAWGTDAMVDPAHRGKGWGEALYRCWDRNTGASIGLSYTDASYKLFEKMAWPFQGTVARFAKPISARARAEWKAPRRSIAAEAATRWQRFTAARQSVRGEIERLRRVDASVTRLWERVAPKFAFAARRDADYLDWRYLRAPSGRYEIVALRRDGETAGFAVYRHAAEGAQRATVIVDYLADPDEPEVLTALLRAVEREAAAAKSDVLRAWASHAAFQESFRRAGFDDRPTALRLVVKVNAVPVTPEFYASTDRWHVTRGDSDGDR